MSDKKRRTYPPSMILLGEAVGEGPEGMAFVRDIFHNRALASKKTVEEIANAPYQFSAAARPDLEEFSARQPLIFRNLADELLRESAQPGYVPKYPGIQHYVTKELFSRRNTLPKNHWLHKMKVVQTVGNHVALVEK